MPRDGSIGDEIFAQVEKLVAEGMNRTQAFAQISQETGRAAGTVAANYYRVARKRAGGSLRKPKPKTTSKNVTSRNTKRSRRRPGETSVGAVDRLSKELVTNIQALTAAIKAQDAEIRELRARLDNVRGALG